MTATLLHSQLPDVITQAERLPTLPTAAVEILHLSRDTEASIEELAEVLALDPALAAKILMTANSVAFRRGSEITSLTRAVLQLGMHTVQFLALSFSLTASLPRSGPDRNFDYLSYWQYSVAMAVAAQEFARLINSPQKEEAFLCGLLGRFGQLVMAQVVPDQYAEVLAQSPHSLPSAALEHDVLGFDYHQVGANLLQTWGFPDMLVRKLQPK